MQRQHRTSQHEKRRSLSASLASNCLIAALLLLAGAWFLVGSPRGTTDGLKFQLPSLEAQLGAGEYLFFPNRRNIWVVNSRNGRMIHYRFLDTTQGTVERSHVAQIDPRLFPPGDAIFKISERNITDYLWVGNQRTGDFQLWRRNVRDGNLITDPKVISSSQHLMTPRLDQTNAQR